MDTRESPPTIWLIDPISYSGMAYSDVGQIVGLRELGARAVLVGSDSWMLEPDLVPRLATFRGTHGTRSRLRRGVAYVASLARLLTDVAKTRPDIVHWQFTELPIADLLTMLVIRILRIRQVYTAHELLPWTASRHHRWVFARLYGLMDAVIVHNEDQRAAITRDFPVRPCRVHVVPLGDYALFATPQFPQVSARTLLGLSADPPIALFFGAIRPSKGLEVLLEAWALVLEAVPEAILLITGKPYKGLDTSEIVALIRRLGIDKAVETRFEQVDPAVTNTYYRAADLVVLPYHDIGTSGVLRYAYNSGRAVVATAVGEHASRIVDGETGFLIPPGNSRALAAVLVDALGDRSNLDAMGEAARVYAAANFRWLDSAKGLHTIYEDLRRRS